MSIDPFPERVSPRKLCNRNDSINSILPVEKLLRLSEFLHDNHGQAQVSLSFEKDDAGHCLISGNLTADVRMLCQRCLEATEVKLASDFAIKVAETDKEAQDIAQSSANNLEQLEVVRSEEGELDLLSLVEDELIMSLPIVASHADKDCSKTLQSLQQKARQAGENLASGSIQGLEALAELKQALKEENDKQK